MFLHICIYIYISVIVGEDILFSIINYHQASNKIDSQFYMEQLLQPENRLHTTGFEPVPCDCSTRKRASLWEVLSLYIRENI